MERLQQVLQMEVGKSWFKIKNLNLKLYPWECPNPGMVGGVPAHLGFKVPNHSGILYSASSQPLCSEIWKEQIFKVQPGSPWSCQDPRQPLHTWDFVLFQSHIQSTSDRIQFNDLQSLLCATLQVNPLSGLCCGNKVVFEVFLCPWSCNLSCWCWELNEKSGFWVPADTWEVMQGSEVSKLCSSDKIQGNVTQRCCWGFFRLSVLSDWFLGWLQPQQSHRQQQQQKIPSRLWFPHLPLVLGAPDPNGTN